MYLHTVGGENQMLRGFDFDVISVATENFSVANIISGNDRYGYIYKGKLKNGQDIAIYGPPEPSNRVSNQQFMDEVSILVQVEHKNLIQLLGYCIKGTGTYLIYDFAPYATLSSLLFDPDCALLGWDERYKILLGVARALVYLQQHAPSRIMHCDVNPSNILLDEQMNPKLSFFKFARGYATRGYVAPEYLFHGHLSTKTDVYGFGVVVLETVWGHSVRKEDLRGINKGFRKLFWSNLVKRAYTNLVDPRIVTKVHSTVMKRVIHIGLLCIQDLPKERPTMEEVVGMLLGTSSMDLVPKMEEVVGMLLGTSSMDLLVPKESWISENLDVGYWADDEFEG